jgi:hypothetical protein
MLLRFGGTERLGTDCDRESRGREVQGRPAVQMSPEIGLSIAKKNVSDQQKIG